MLDQKILENLITDFLINSIKERFDFITTNIKMFNILDFNSTNDIIISDENKKYLKVFGANNIYFNNSKYILFLEDEKLNKSLCLVKDLMLSKSEIFLLYEKILEEIDYDNEYSHSDVFDTVQENADSCMTIQEIINFFKNLK